MAYKDPKKAAEYRHQYYLKNKEKIWSYAVRRENHLLYRSKHKEKLSAYAKDRYWDNKDVLNEKGKDWRIKNEAYVKSMDHKKTQELTDGYMRKHLLKLGYTRVQIKRHPELLESHRLIIKIKRLCKTSKN